MFQLSGKNFWCLAVVVLFLPLVYGETIDFSYPQTITAGQNFSVFLKVYNLSSSLDIKIDLLNSSGRIGQIYDNSWKSTYYYIIDAMNSTKNESWFSLNITENYFGQGIINLTLRAGSNYYRYNYTFNILENNITLDTPPVEKNNSSLNLTKNAQIYFELDYPEEVYNDEEIEVQVLAYNLQALSYDVKLYVIKEDKTISETCNINDSWKSSSYYFNNFLSGFGNKTKTAKIRVTNDVTGDFPVKIKVRENGHEAIIYERDYSIHLNRRTNHSEDIQSNTEKNNSTGLIAGQSNEEEIIALNGAKDINNPFSWKSKVQYLKEYGIYFFAGFCVFLIVLLLLRRK